MEHQGAKTSSSTPCCEEEEGEEEVAARDRSSAAASPLLASRTAPQPAASASLSHTAIFLRAESSISCRRVQFTALPPLNDKESIYRHYRGLC